MTTKFTAHQLRSFYNPFRIILKIALSISLLIQVTLAVSDDRFRISSLSLDGENDINQCTNHLLQFRWSYSHSAENLLIDLVLIRQNADSDTVIWSSGIRSLDDTAFRYVSFSDIHDGGTYKFSIRSKHPGLGWTEWKHLAFQMNSLPAAPYFLLDQNHVFTGEKMTFPFALPTDKQVERSAITYQITISRDSTGNDVILDTTFSEPKGKGDSRVFCFIQNFEENQRFFTRIRAFDGAEYSSWSGALPFYVNTVNEPPERFHLKSPISGEITPDYPTLSWNYAKDPDENLGGGIQEYIVLIATDQEFTQVIEQTHSSPDICSYQTKNLDNHRTYYWSVIARDVGGLESKSRQIGFFTPNSGNIDPLPPILVSPKDSSIVKPTDYISWYLQDDPDVYDRISCEILILSIDGLEIFMKKTLTDSIINIARQYHYPGIEASYDNKIKFRLNRLAKIESLKEGELYQFQVKVWDNWGGSIISEWEDAIFRFDDGINVPPLPPDDILKPDSEILTTSTPYLYWSPGYDSDISDRLRYQVILNQNKEFKSRTYIVLETPYNTTEIEVKNPLLENRQYFWKVRSIDMSDAKSEWSRTGSFWVNSINEPPFGPIELISPSSLSEVRPESWFWWFKGSDPDPGDRVLYILEIDKEPDFKSPVIKHRIERHRPDAIWSETISKPPNAVGFPLNKIPDHTILKDNALYYWRVTAIDDKGLKCALTGNPPRFAYNLLNDPPSAVKAGFRPSGGEIIKTLTPQINWEQATDPDFTDYHRTLMYQVELSSQTLFSPKNTRLYLTSPGENFIKIPESLEENCEYFYRVRVQDSLGAYSPWSHIQSFITNATEEPPNPVTKGFLPKDSMIVKSRTPLISWLPSDDPDPMETERVLHYIIRYTPISGTKKLSQIASKVGITSVRFSPLQENKYYSYQVAAVDPRGIQSKWSKPIVFGVNSQEQSPEHFSIISPLFNEDSVSTDAAFIWRSTYDFDPGSDINYHLYYGTDNLFITNTEIVVIAPQGGDSIVYNPLVEFSYFTRYYWKLAAVDNTGNRRWASNSDQHPFVFRIAGPRRHADISFAPAKFYLYQNYPNPFNEKTLIKYETAEYCNVRVTIYDLLGKKVKTLVSGNHAQGIYDTYWSGRDLNGSLVPGGMYICQMEAGGFTSHRKIVLLR